MSPRSAGRGIRPRLLTRGRRLTVATLLVLAATAIGVTAGLSADDRSGSGAPSVLDDPAIQAAAQQSLQEQQKRDAERDTSDARAARVASRDAYADQSAAEALATDKSELPDVVSDPAFKPFDPGPDSDVEQYHDGDTSAIVETADGEKVLAESNVPLRGMTADGDRAPVDLSLDADGGHFAAESAPVRAALPSDLGDGIALPVGEDTIRVHPVGANVPATRADDDKLLYANTQEDADLLASPLPTGIELSNIIRSPAAPETFAYQFDGLPAGAELKLAADGHAAVIVEGTETLLVVRPPLASDADGVPLPVSLAVAGDRLELTVRHRDRDVRYPLVLDPIILPPEVFTWGASSSNNDFNGWTYTFVPGAGSPAHTPGFTPTQFGILQYGLYTYTNGLNLYNQDDGIDRFTAPGDAYVYRADFSGLGNSNRTGAPYIECLNAGIYNVNGAAADSTFYVNCGNFSGVNWGTCVSGTYPNCNVASGAAGNAAQVDYWAYLTGVRANGDGLKYVGGASVYLNDRVNPTIQWAGDPPPSGGWGPYSDTYSVQASDSGLGVKTVTAKAPVTAPSWPGATLNTNCNGTRADRAAGRCTNPQPLTFDLSGLPEGPQTVHLSATDAVSNQSPGLDWSIKVDRTAPQLTVTGSLKDADGKDIGDGRYTLHVVADDGIPRSGVQSIEVKVDGTPAATQSQACPNGSCTMTLTPDFGFVGEEYGDGDHTITVTATDFAGNTRTDSTHVTVNSSATDSVGPGDVNLTTGNFSVAADDASIDSLGQGLAIDRTYNSRPTADVGPSPFGPGWTSSLPVDGPSAAFPSLTLADDLNPNVEIATSDGDKLSFAPKKGGGFVSPEGYEDLTLTYDDPSTPTPAQFELKDHDGNVTVFRDTGSGARWPATSVRGAASNTTTSLTYDSSARVQYVFAPAPTGVSGCSSSSTALVTRGCRTLTLTYASSTTATGTTAATCGDYMGRLKSVTLTAYDPASAVMVPTVVSQYQYDSTGRLRAQWDPRISPVLKTTYDYDSAGRLTNLKPPGEASWTMVYGTIPSDPDAGRLQRVSRTGPNGSATTTIAYAVPLSGSGAPNQMGAGDIAAWGQSDRPASATAVFPPDQVPTDPPTSWTAATVHYLDDRGYEVNTALPGGHITTSEYDAHGNGIRTLSAANRERVLAGAASASQVDNRFTYSPDGIDLVDQLGPLHPISLANGQTASARRHTHMTYDEGAPAGGPYHLQTTMTVGAQIGGSDSDVRTTKTRYDGQSNLGWTLRRPTSKILDAVAGGLNLKTTTLYDAASGSVIESRRPANPNGGDAHATQTIAYSAGNSSDPACGYRPEWAGLPCKTQPAAQPNTSGIANIPVTTYSYNRLNQVSGTTEAIGPASRTATVQYDAAGRRMGGSVTATDGAAVPSVTYAYDSASGRPTTTTATDSTGVTRTLARAYDSLGRQTSYTDADGNTSTTAYDLLDRPVTVYDGKGTQTWSYDTATGLPTSLTDSSVGSFAATYNGDGQMLSETLPNGLRETNTYDETGRLVHRSYVKTTNCSASCTWLDFGGSKSIHDQWLSLSGTLGTQSYVYDGAGRLTRASDTPTGQGCTVRDYFYDADSNRTSQTTHAPGTDGSCDPSSSGITKAHSYDAGDRLTDASTTYDNLGRTSTLAASNAGGGALASTYYADDLTRSSSQDGVTNTYFRDPDGRLRSVQTVGASGQTTILHHSDGSDSVAWQTESADGSHWSRNVAGIDGDLVAVQDNVTGTALQLVNLHGDIVSTASTDPAATGPAGTARSDEFGTPQGASIGRYRWLGAMKRQKVLSSGVLEMGARQYVPALGRFTQVDGIPGGAANAYDYAGQDPVNSSDLDGRARVHGEFVECTIELQFNQEYDGERWRGYLFEQTVCNDHPHIDIHMRAKYHWSGGEDSHTKTDEDHGRTAAAVGTRIDTEHKHIWSIHYWARMDIYDPDPRVIFEFAGPGCKLSRGGRRGRCEGSHHGLGETPY